MLKTKRRLDAENKLLRERLAAQGGETRKALNARVKELTERNETLEVKVEMLEAKVTELTAPKVKGGAPAEIETQAQARANGVQ